VGIVLTAQDQAERRLVNEAAALVHRVLPELTRGESGEFVATLASLAGSLLAGLIPSRNPA
jgi:hypothetical protein